MKTKIISLIAAILVSCPLLNAQINLGWYRNYGKVVNLVNNPSRQSVTADSNGNFYTLSIIYDTLSTNFSLMVLKYSGAGELLWERNRNLNFSSSMGDYSCYIKTDRSDNPVIVYNFADSQYKHNIGLMKLKQNGDVIWERFYHDVEDGDDYASEIYIDELNNIYITGVAVEPYSGGFNKCILLKYGQEGILIWERRMNEYTAGSGIIADKHGCAYIAGVVFSGSYGKTLMMTSKFDSSGTRLWMRSYGLNTMGYDGAKRIVLDDSGNVIVGGTTFTSSFYITILKYNNNGTLIWERVMPPLIEITSLTTDSRGNVYVTGYGEMTPDRLLKFDKTGPLVSTYVPQNIGMSVVQYGGGKILYLAGNMREGTSQKMGFYFSTLDTNLNVLHNNYFLADTSNFSIYNSFCLNKNGSVYLSGYCFYDIYPYVFYKLTSVKLSLTTGINNEQVALLKDFILYQNYPNPFNNSTCIAYSVPRKTNITISIFDATGRNVKTLFRGMREAGSYSVLFNADKLASGIYYCRMIAENSLYTRKMIILK